MYIYIYVCKYIDMIVIKNTSLAQKVKHFASYTTPPLVNFKKFCVWSWVRNGFILNPRLVGILCSSRFAPADRISWHECSSFCCIQDLISGFPTETQHVGGLFSENVRFLGGNCITFLGTVFFVAGVDYLKISFNFECFWGTRKNVRQSLVQHLF